MMQMSWPYLLLAFSFSADSLLLYSLSPFLIPSLLKGEAVLTASCVLKADFVPLEYRAMYTVEHEGFWS